MEQSTIFTIFMILAIVLNIAYIYWAKTIADKARERGLDKLSSLGFFCLAYIISPPLAYLVLNYLYPSKDKPTGSGINWKD